MCCDCLSYLYCSVNTSCARLCAQCALVELFAADNSMCGQAAFLFLSAVESRDWNYVSIHGFCGQLLLWAIKQKFFFLQSNSMWKDILTIRGKNDTGSQCAQTCFLIYSRTLRASLLWSNSRRHPHTHPPASIHHKIPLEANILVIDFSSQVSADSRDE